MRRPFILVVVGIVGCLVGSAPANAQQDVIGKWAGQVNQVGDAKPYSVKMDLVGREGRTDYPELNCGGRLTLVGQAAGYAFYTETIDRGRVSPDKPGGCIDGTITVGRAGDNLGWVWFGVYRSSPYYAYSVLKPVR